MEAHEQRSTSRSPEPRAAQCAPSTSTRSPRHRSRLLRRRRGRLSSAGLRRQPHPSGSPQSRRQPRLQTSSRAALLALVLVASPALPAFSVGIPGPKELLREQKKTASYLLAPIDASRDTLLKAQAQLASPNASSEEVRGWVGAAGRDCVARQRNSIVAFQSRTDVEICTFSLILKNATSLLANKDPLKLEVDTRLGELIESFSDLGTVVESSNFEIPVPR